MEQLVIVMWAVEAMRGLFVVTLISGICLFMGCVFSSDTTKEIKEKLKYFRVLFGICICITFLAIVTPSQKIILMYAGIKGGEAVVNTPEFEKARALFNKTIDSYLKEDNK